ncbi:MAG: DUF1799 domain-containing protein [Candidatus Thiodiazotropha sp. (ex Dulcina madagascariensis)]|nr:DUF1799 domain-containing protein [Candidatus Thiodiazotropha sp. (ex Dulcina madagascariensis)]
MGAPQAVIDQVSEAAKEREIFDVLPENWDAVRLFNAVRTQWRIGGMAGIPTGLDYPAVEMVMNRLGFDDAAFAQLQLMETTALQHWADTRT